MVALRRGLTRALACGTLALAARGQIELDWWRAYDLPESVDGDSSTDSIAVSDDGDVVAAVWTPLARTSRFLKRSASGALTWSKVYPGTRDYRYWRALTEGGGRSYFLG